MPEAIMLGGVLFTGRKVVAGLIGGHLRNTVHQLGLAVADWCAVSENKPRHMH